MRQYKAQFISMILMITIGVGIFVGFNMEWVSIDTNKGFLRTQILPITASFRRKAFPKRMLKKRKV